VVFSPDLVVNPTLFGKQNFSFSGTYSTTRIKTALNYSLLPDSLKYYAETVEIGASGVRNFTLTNNKINGNYTAFAYETVYGNRRDTRYALEYKNLGIRKNDLSGTFTRTNLLDILDSTLLPVNYSMLSKGNKSKARGAAIIFISYELTVTFSANGSVQTGVVTSGNTTLGSVTGSRWGIRAISN
jgi:hypothetical protein